MLLGRVYTGACKHDGLVLVLKKNVAEKKVVHYFLLINTGKVYRARVFTGRVVCRPTNQKIPESFRVACPWGTPFPSFLFPSPSAFPPFTFCTLFPSILLSHLSSMIQRCKLPQRVRAKPGRQTIVGEFRAQNQAPGNNHFG